jgi:hypothetical protein
VVPCIVLDVVTTRENLCSCQKSNLDRLARLVVQFWMTYTRTRKDIRDNFTYLSDRLKVDLVVICPVLYTGSTLSNPGRGAEFSAIGS